MRILEKSQIIVAIAATFTLLATSCSTPPTKQQIGLVTGGVAGAAIGSLFGGGSGKVLATGIGAVGGAFIGSEIGKSMEETDKQNTTLAMNNGLQASSWTNQNGVTYTIEPNTKMYVKNDQVCRNFQAIMNDGQAAAAQETSGTACQSPKTAAWNVV